MSLTGRGNWLAVSLAAIAIAAAGMGLSGCKKETTPEKTTQPEDAAKEPGDGSGAKPEDSPKPEGASQPVPAGPDISTYAPADDLVGQVAHHIDRLGKALETEEDFADSEEKIAKDANTLIVLALALGLHDEDNRHKAAAGALIKAATDLAAAEHFLQARQALAEVKEAAASQDEAEGELKWEKVASLHALMEKIPGLNMDLKRYLRSESRFSSRADKLAGNTATVAVIAQASMAHADDTELPDEVQQWQDLCVQLRDAAGAYNAAVHKGDFDAAVAANDKLQQSCEDCHAVFHQEEEEDH